MSLPARSPHARFALVWGGVTPAQPFVATPFLGRGMIRLETLIELKFLNSSFFKLILLLELDKQFPVEQFEATVSQSTVPSPPLTVALLAAPGVKEKEKRRGTQ